MGCQTKGNASEYREWWEFWIAISNGIQRNINISSLCQLYSKKKRELKQILYILLKNGKKSSFYLLFILHWQRKVQFSNMFKTVNERGILIGP